MWRTRAEISAQAHRHCRRRLQRPNDRGESGATQHASAPSDGDQLPPSGGARRCLWHGTRRPEHLLNVAARNMSAFRDEPDRFLRWLRTRSEFDTMPEIELRERFIPRMVYGDYLRSIMHHYLQSADGMTPVTTEFVAGEGLDIDPAGDTVVIRLADSTAVEADRVVLATGNEPPAALPGSETLAGHAAWMGDPWQPLEKRLPGQGESIVVLGA